MFSMVVNAAKSENAAVTFQNIGGVVPTFNFRTSPGGIHLPGYSYATITFPNKPSLEAHIGVYIQGGTGVAHECDVVVIDESEAQLCRANPGLVPRNSHVVLAIECKFYGIHSSLLGQARGFIGWESDIGPKKCHFVINREPQNVSQLLAGKNKEWWPGVVPSSTQRVQQLRSALETAFRDFRVRVRR